MKDTKLIKKITFRLSPDENIRLLDNVAPEFSVGEVIRAMINKYNKDINFRKDIYCDIDLSRIEKITNSKEKYNFDKQKEYNRNRQIKYRNANDINKLKSNVRNRMHSGLKAKNVSKNQKSQEYLGCSYAKYKLYLENKFEKEMSWDNYGEWHIDHIIPLASAKTEDELIKLFHYTNTQPLWKKDNLIKGARYDYTTEN